MLFATEMWERFSYSGMSSLLVLYLVKYAAAARPGRGRDRLRCRQARPRSHLRAADARSRLPRRSPAFHAALRISTPILGGYVADRFFGQRIMAVVGALLMAAGHFLMMFEVALFFALGCLILGIGAFKPNVSTQVGALYALGDPRRVPRLFDLLSRHQHRHVPRAADRRDARPGGRLALRLRGRRRRHAGRHSRSTWPGCATCRPTRCAICRHRRLPARAAHAERTAGDRRADLRIRAVTFFWATYEPAGRDDPVLGARTSPTGRSTSASGKAKS